MVDSLTWISKVKTKVEGDNVNGQVNIGLIDLNDILINSNYWW
jgi:hypothetical protein